MDSISKEHRSWNMSRIRSKNTKPELLVRKYLYSKGVRYRLHTKLPGKPDITVRKKQTVIFVNGCFWHGHKGCKYSHLPKTRIEYWTAKIGRNIERDAQNYKQLKEAGWRVIIIWECEIKRNSDETLQNVLAMLIRE